LFNEIEELAAALLFEDFTDERAERVNILAQRFVLRREMDLTADHEGILGLRPGRRAPRLVRNPPSLSPTALTPGIGHVREVLALGAHYAEPLPGRRLHHPPALPLLDALGPERFQPTHFGL